jgi:hypothetical protein
MYHSRWRERLPGKLIVGIVILCLFAIISMIAYFFLSFAARPAFYKYVIIMFILNAIALFACGLTGSGAGFAFWFDSSIS